MGDMIDPMGEGRNPREELKGWNSKRDWQEAETHSPGKCHVSGDKLVVIGKTKKKGLSIWASEKSDGSLHTLATRTAEEKQAANEANDQL
jgi:hypothetical protein